MSAISQGLLTEVVNGIMLPLVTLSSVKKKIAGLRMSDIVTEGKKKNNINMTNN